MVLFLLFQSLFILTEAMPDEKQTDKPMRVFFQDQQESSEWKRLSVIAHKVHHAAAIVHCSLNCYILSIICVSQHIPQSFCTLSVFTADIPSIALS